MNDLIDKNIICEKIHQIFDKYYDETKAVTKRTLIINICCEVMKCIAKIPSTDTVKADTERHAHWTRINDVLSQCSNCKTTILRCDTDNYCSHCGCKMDEVIE